MLHSAYDAVKAVDPAMPVIGGALANWQSNTADGKISALNFATAMFQAGAASYMDAISIHPYPQTFTPLDHTLFMLGINQMRNARATVNASTPIWITELGISTTGSNAISEAAQASVLSDTFNWVQTQSDIQAFFVHALTEPDQNTGSSEMGYALLHGTAAPFTAKPAFTALQNAAAPAPVPLSMTVNASSPQPGARTGTVTLSAACNQSCQLSASGTVALKFFGSTASTYTLTGASGSGTADTPATLTLRLSSTQTEAISNQMRFGYTPVAAITVNGTGAGGSATRQVSVTLTS